jgi:hypothetical protein
MIPGIEYYKREHLIVNFEGDVEDDTCLKIFDLLNLDESRPNFVDHLQNTCGYVHQVFYLFEESIPCPSGERLESLLSGEGFVGDAIIRKGEQEVWRKSFSK